MKNKKGILLGIITILLLNFCSKRKVSIDGYFPQDSDLVLNVNYQTLEKSPLIQKIKNSFDSNNSNFISLLINFTNYNKVKSSHNHGMLIKLSKALRKAKKKFQVNKLALAIPHLETKKTLVIGHIRAGNDGFLNNIINLYQEIDSKILVSKIKGFNYYRLQDFSSDMGLLELSPKQVLFGSNQGIELAIRQSNNKNTYQLKDNAKETFFNIVNHKQIKLGINTSTIIESIANSKFNSFPTPLPQINYLALTAKVESDIKISIGVNFKKKTSAIKLAQIIQSQIALITLMSKTALVQMGVKIAISDMISFDNKGKTLVINIKIPQKLALSLISMGQTIKSLFGNFNSTTSKFGAGFLNAPFGSFSKFNFSTGSRINKKLNNQMQGNNMKSLQDRMKKMLNNNL